MTKEEERKTAEEKAEEKREEEPEKVQEDQKKAKRESQKKALEMALSERDEYLNALMRERADFDNYKKRNATAMSGAYASGKADTVTELLPVIDNLERAAKVECADKAYREGVLLVLKQTLDALEKMGVTPIDPSGEPFDPNFHNAVMQVPCEEDDESGTVKNVLMKGYMMDGKVIRHAMVQVTE